MNSDGGIIRQKTLPTSAPRKQHQLTIQHSNHQQQLFLGLSGVFLCSTADLLSSFLAACCLASFFRIIFRAKSMKMSLTFSSSFAED
jgi:hypothetical protein